MSHAILCNFVQIEPLQRQRDEVYGRIENAKNEEEDRERAAHQKALEVNDSKETSIRLRIQLFAQHLPCYAQVPDFYRAHLMPDDSASNLGVALPDSAVAHARLADWRGQLTERMAVPSDSPSALAGQRRAAVIDRTHPAFTTQGQRVEPQRWLSHASLKRKRPSLLKNRIFSFS